MRSVEVMEPLEGLTGNADMMTIFEEAGLIPLLRPIMDITKHWDFDICKCLDMYIDIVKHCDAESTNFPIAATIVQNTSTLYGKKVDFLFQSTMQLLEQLTGRNLGKKSNEEDDDDNDAENGETQEGARKEKKKKKNKVLELADEDMFPLDNIISDKCLERVISENHQLREVETIIPNTPVKPKPKPGTEINIYNKRGEIMGQKHEFRLHWYVSNEGILMEDFNYDKRHVIPTVNTCRDLTVFEFNNDQEDDPGNAIACNDSHNDDYADDIGPPERNHEICLERMNNRPGENLVNERDVNFWLQKGPEVVLAEKPTSKKKTKNVPPELEENKRENKRKWNKFKKILTKYEIIYFIKMDRLKEYDMLKFDVEVSDVRRAKQLILKRRRLYNALLAKEARQNLVEDFPGFSDTEPDPDEEHGFPGFDENQNDDDNCDNNVDVHMPSQDLFTADPVNSQGGADTYEDEARKALQDFRNQKLHYDCRMSDLAKRVAAWHQTIIPKLEAAEERAHFDIHEYGSRILDKFPRSNGKFTLPFQEIVMNEKAEDIARFFLSSLMLANTYNIEISKSDPGDLAVDCMDLTLLSRARHFDELDDNMRATSNKN